MVDGDDASSAQPEDIVVVFWRPGCFFCVRLFRAFEQRGVRHGVRNIWEDEDARAFVRAHNRGNETVPTVALGDDVRTNPDPRDYIGFLEEVRPDLVARPDDSGGRWLGLLRR
ncbi:MAG: glutaredoxin family protein [Acidimicrobiales bacterium]